MKRPIADDLPRDPNDFLGFKALKRLFMTLMEKRYGSDLPAILLPDVHDWLAVLEDPEDLDGKLATYHGWILLDLA